VFTTSEVKSQLAEIIYKSLDGSSLTSGNIYLRDGFICVMLDDHEFRFRLILAPEK